MNSDLLQLPEEQPQQFIRPLGALRTVSHFCNELAAQEARDGEFHTLIAMDMDVVHMAAFPCETLALGSVFHAWPPLREASEAMSAALEAGTNKDRLTVLERIFARSELRIPLLTTIALSSFIFDRRSRTEKFQCYAVLPPLLQEWSAGLERARTDAARFSNTLGKAVDAEAIKRIVDDALRQNVDVAAKLLNALPETASALFPAELSPDHALASFLRWQLGGVIRPYDKIEGLPPFAALKPNLDSRGGFREWQKRIEEDFTASDAYARMTSKQQAKALAGQRRLMDNDAEVLSVLQAVRDRPPPFESPEHSPKPLRLLLLTASARLWRVARAGGIAEDCLRNPIAYLSDGRFYDWAFDGLRTQDHTASLTLLDRLREGLLSQWLEPLTKAREGDTRTKVLHQTFVDDWERLMSHLSTTLSLHSPISGLRRTLDALKGPGARSADIAALLQHKIVDITQRLTHHASQMGLAHVSATTTTLRNLPPVDLRLYPTAQGLLCRLATEDLSNDSKRLALLQDIMAMQVSAEAAKPSAGYFQSILISLLWFRLHQWAIANDVVGQAVSFALYDLHSDGGADEVVRTQGDLRGDEALYLASVTGRLCASKLADLEVPRLALEFAIKLSQKLKASSNVVLRLQSETVTFKIAELLFSMHPASSSPLLALADHRAWPTLQDTIDLLNGTVWQGIRQTLLTASIAEHPGNDKHDTYIKSYALQQMYCSVGMLFLILSVRARQDAGLAGPVAVLIGEFQQLSARWSVAQPVAMQVVDSDIARSIRQLAVWLLSESGALGGGTETGPVNAAYCERLIEQAALHDMAPLDRLRLEWLGGVHAREAKHLRPGPSAATRSAAI